MWQLTRHGGVVQYPHQKQTDTIVVLPSKIVEKYKKRKGHNRIRKIIIQHFKRSQKWSPRRYKERTHWQLAHLHT